jgi:hypothetical protein
LAHGSDASVVPPQTSTNVLFAQFLHLQQLLNSFSTLRQVSRQIS